MTLRSALLVLGLSLVLLQLVNADTPANCTHHDLMGLWNFQFTAGGQDKNINCSDPGPVVQTIQFRFHGKNQVVKLSDQEEGHFNLIYNQGFEVLLAYRKMFAFFHYHDKDFACNVTMWGWQHDSNERDWSCFKAQKVAEEDGGDEDKVKFEPHQKAKMSEEEKQDRANLHELLKQVKFQPHASFIDEINNSQQSWQAVDYGTNLTYHQVLKRAGWGQGPLYKQAAPLTQQEKDEVENSMPRSLDWRNVGGVDYVSPVRNQLNCGSCYAFASMAMLEARVRVQTHNRQKPVFSPQYIVSCSRYAQGCDGGFPYLISGKHAQDFGVLDESCYPYEGRDTPTCTPLPNCTTASSAPTYVARYNYVGGYYGGCNEHRMMAALMESGPIAVAIQVWEDFMHYKGGIYHHVTRAAADPFRALIGFDPFELTNHAVLVVGWGEDFVTREKYWIVKNSWGEEWGEGGYVRIRRGVDEIAIESLAQESFPIPKLL